MEIGSLEALEQPRSLALRPHPYRDFALREVHARPYAPVEAPRRVLHFAFLTDAHERDADRKTLAAFCRDCGVEPPPLHMQQVRIPFGDKVLRWEQHGEFTTYAWSFADTDGKLFERPAIELAWPMGLKPQCGAHLVSVDLSILPQARIPDLDSVFARESLCAVQAEDGAALVATDFKAGPDGFVKFLLADDGLPAIRRGALAQKVLELETYRMLALMGLPEAHRISPSVRRIEKNLMGLTRRMTSVQGLDDSQALLDQLAELAAELEAGAAESMFRFGASRAYYDIVLERLEAIQDEPAPGRETFSGFLSRRMGPALQTCASVEERQINLSRKLARATQLLRTRVDIGLEQQNRDLLAKLSERARMQLRLQKTVEGLSIAAVSYYVVGLLAHMAQALSQLGAPIAPEVAVAAAVPLVVAGVGAVVVKRLRAHA